MNFSRPILFFVSLVCMSCASTYHPLLTERFTYPSVKESAGLEVAYQYDILKEAGNAKYAKKEKRRNVHIVAVALKNKTLKPINVEGDLEFYIGNHQVVLLEPEEAKHRIRQVSGLYLFWSFFHND